MSQQGETSEREQSRCKEFRFSLHFGCDRRENANRSKLYSQLPHLKPVGQLLLEKLPHKYNQPETPDGKEDAPHQYPESLGDGI